MERLRKRCYCSVSSRLSAWYDVPGGRRNRRVREQAYNGRLMSRYAPAEPRHAKPPSGRLVLLSAMIPAPAKRLAAAPLVLALLVSFGGTRQPAPPPGRPGSVRILLVGDSTVTDDSGWGAGFKARLADGAECVNLAKNGRSSRSYIGEGLWAAVLAERAGYVLIQFGHNDMPGKGPDRETDPQTTYREFLGRYVDEARAHGMTPVVVTSLTRRFFGPDGRIASDLGPYVEAARDVAALKKAPLIDLHTRSIDALNRLGPKAADELNPLKDDGTPDRTHLTARGAALFGGIVANELRRVVPALAPNITMASWTDCLDQPAPWYGSPEAVRVAGNILLYQRSTGGWPKNIDMARVLSPDERAAIAGERTLTDSTIDNGATTTQIRFLARVHAATRAEAWRTGPIQGLRFLLEAQYPNGGWPQFFPLQADYSRYITFNDGVIKHSLAQIELERRAGYNWIDRFAAGVLETDYPAWLKARARRP